MGASRHDAACVGQSAACGRAGSGNHGFGGARLKMGDGRGILEFICSSFNPKEILKCYNTKRVTNSDYSMNCVAFHVVTIFAMAFH